MRTFLLSLLVCVLALGAHAAIIQDGIIRDDIATSIPTTTGMAT